jgi:hypothetical protein
MEEPGAGVSCVMAPVGTPDTSIDELLFSEPSETRKVCVCACTYVLLSGLSRYAVLQLS